MKTIGLLGGMSWESTVVYYQIINRLARQRLGGLHSAQILLWSFDFAAIEACQAAGRWDDATALMIDAARRLEKGGADGVILGCTEIGLLLSRDDLDVPVFDTTELHAAAALDFTELSVKPTGSLVGYKRM